MHCLTAWGQWVVQLLQYTASLPRGSGQWNSCNELPHRLGAMGCATPAMRYLIAWGHWAVELLLCTATLLTGSGQWNSYNALPHCLGAVGSATPALRGPTDWGDGGSCPGGSRCLKSGTPAMHCLTAWG